MKKGTIKVNGTTYNVVNYKTFDSTEKKTISINKDCRSIYDVYNSPSTAKTRIWYHIENICKDLNGFNLTVSGHSCHFFSAYFLFKHAGKTYRMSFYPSKWYVVNRIA